MPEDALAAGQAALEVGRWADAREGFESSLREGETAEARLGLATAHWWTGESQASVTQGTRAYTLFRRAGNVEGAVQCAVWLAMTYKANFANYPAANGWLGRADRLLAPLPATPMRGWIQFARAYRMTDLDVAEALTATAVELARATGDVDLELSALSQLGLIWVGTGRNAEGFALIDETMAAALAGDCSSLDTVVYACCDMLNACELTSDIERAAQWCRVADDFVDRFGCPFLYAECRIYYGSILSAKGRWEEAERELDAGMRITDGVCPGLHARALTRMAGLRVRQGRLEEAARLLARAGDETEAETETTLSVAALHMARGDARAASRLLRQRLPCLAEHDVHLATALELLVEASVESGDIDAAGAAAVRLAALGSSTDSGRLTALAAGASGRVATAVGDLDTAVNQLQAALAEWSRMGLPFEAARARFELGRVHTATNPDVAIEHLRRSLDAFQTLGAGIEADRAAALLRSLGINARTGAKGVGLLTDREQQVLRLLGAGLTNPEIAERLHVSRRTASHHVSHILAKLHLRNRAEAAAHAVATREWVN